MPPFMSLLKVLPSMEFSFNGDMPKQGLTHAIFSRLIISPALTSFEEQKGYAQSFAPFSL